MIVLARPNRAGNADRFYALEVAPTLFGEWAVLLEWGRHGAPGRTLTRYFPDQVAAERDSAARIKAKRRRGYAPKPY
jgi:predicted DNA-binding WGR domain protein